MARAFVANRWGAVQHKAAVYAMGSGPPATEAGDDQVVAKVHGLTVSDDGFKALLLTEGGGILAVPIDGETEGVAKTPEALTLLQLFQNIDMAGTMLPPDVLQVKYAEALDLPITYNGTTYGYAAASPWLRVRSIEQIPRVELLRIVIRAAPEGGAKEGGGLRPELHCCRSSGADLASVVLSEGVSNFEAVALALRYKSQTEVRVETEFFKSGFFREPKGGLGSEDGPRLGLASAFPESDLPDRFPLWRSEKDAAEQEARITKSLVSSVESSKLEGALKIARERGDKKAEKKIREALRKFDLARADEAIPVVADEGGSGQGPGGDTKSPPTADAPPDAPISGAAAAAAAAVQAAYLRKAAEEGEKRPEAEGGVVESRDAEAAAAAALEVAATEAFGISQAEGDPEAPEPTEAPAASAMAIDPKRNEYENLVEFLLALELSGSLV
eukprot:CAMPEP_0172604970 /NCGR_PEP_ID=MMETSP1068-20121228/25222_1 /TAXON_ID=35684 /ORGANISM="Pseudopedinella elastica, Strain CCMP716" /LENGTH=443 /DNA_ID=CAMNT_0013407223 /DNA_START=162 /DNA_END=1493 /DNA_ORIENTATION=-